MCVGVGCLLVGFDEVGEGGDFVGYLSCEPLLCGVDGLPGGDVVLLCVLLYFVYGGVADGSFGLVDGAEECFFVVGVGDEGEVCEEVFDFFALVEGDVADDLVGDVFA